MANIKKSVDIIKENIQSYCDFPKPGIIFRDIFSLMRVPVALRALQEVLLDHVKSSVPQIEAVVALESRGFLLGPLISLHFGIPFVPIRKKGKLPGIVKEQSFTLEYGMDTFEIQTDSIAKSQKVVIVDDLLATGGSLSAACGLLKQLDADIVQCIVVMEIVDLKGRDIISAPVHSIVQF